MPSAAQVAARLRRFAPKLAAADVTPNARAYVVAAVFPAEAEAAAAAAHLRGHADSLFNAPQARPRFDNPQYPVKLSRP